MVGNHYLLQGLNAPRVGLLADVDTHTKGLESVSVIDGFLGVFRVLLVGVGLLVLLIVHVFKSEAAQSLVLSVHYDSVISGLGGEAVFLSSDDLEFVIVQHADVSYGCRSPVLVFALVFLEESRDDVMETIFVCVMLVELILVFESLDVETHHFW